MCQVCLLDLEYGIPVQARDTALGIEDESLPESDVGKEFRLKEMENAGLLESSFSKVCTPPASSQNVYSAYLALLLTPRCRLVPSLYGSMVYAQVACFATSMSSLQHCIAALSAHDWMCNQAFTFVVIFVQTVY